MGIQILAGASQNFSLPAMVSETTGVSLTGSFKGTATGFGLGFVLPVSQSLRLELGAIYTLRSIEFSLVRNGETVEDGTLSVQSAHVPLVLRRNFGKFFSGCAGAYYEPTLVARNSSGGGTAGAYPDDVGLTFGGRIRVPLGKTWAFFVDGRYNYGFTGANGVSNSSTRQALIFSGLGWYMD